jgi:methionyl-tRNA formyltransferase
MTLRTVFMGSPAAAVPCLQVAARTSAVAWVVTQPDRPAGRGRVLTAPAVAVAARDLGLEVVQPGSVRDGALAARLRAEAIDLAVVVAYGRVLPPEVLAAPRFGCVNLHFSLLPRWRGAAPVQRAILAGDTRTGVALMQLDEGLDTGPVHDTVEVTLLPGETSGELLDRLAIVAAEVLDGFLRRFDPRHPPRARAQAPTGATHAAMLHKNEGAVDWTRSAAEIDRRIRAMDPWPGAFTDRGGERLGLFGSSVVPAPPGTSPAPGQLLGVGPAGLLVAAADAAVAIRDVQPAGGRRMAAAAYLTGRPPREGGERLGGREG